MTLKKQAVILAAGRSTRTFPLTLTRPKPLLKIANTSLLHHNLQELAQIGVSEVHLVVGYKRAMIKRFIKSLNLPMEVHYHYQKDQKGTAHALQVVQQNLKKKKNKLEGFLLLMGDDTYFADELEQISREEHAILGCLHDHPERFGVLKMRGKRLKGLVEKPKNFKKKKGVVNTGAYSLTDEIFKHIDVKESNRGELEITDAVTSLAAKKKVKVVVGTQWVPVGYPWSVLEANHNILARQKREIQGMVEPGAILKGEIHLGRGSVIQAGAYLEGPISIGENTTVGPHSHLRPFTTIGDDCYIGTGASLHSTVLLDGVQVGSHATLSHSVLGEKVVVGPGTITAHQWANGSNIQCTLKGKAVDTGLRQLGAMVGDEAHLGAGSCLHPGTRVWPKLTVSPGEVVTRDLKRKSARTTAPVPTATGSGAKISSQQLSAIRQLVARKGGSGSERKKLSHAFRREFNIKSYSDLSRDSFKQAVTYLGGDLKDIEVSTTPKKRERKPGRPRKPAKKGKKRGRKAKVRRGKRGKISPQQIDELKKVVRKQGKNQAEKMKISHAFRSHFDVSTYSDLPQGKFEEAMEWIKKGDFTTTKKKSTTKKKTKGKGGRPKKKKTSTAKKKTKGKGGRPKKKKTSTAKKKSATKKKSTAKTKKKTSTAKKKSATKKKSTAKTKKKTTEKKKSAAKTKKKTTEKKKSATKTKKKSTDKKKSATKTKKKSTTKAKKKSSTKKKKKVGKPDAKLTSGQLKELRKHITEKSKDTTHRRVLNHTFRREFNISQLPDLTRSQYVDAVEWIKNYE